MKTRTIRIYFKDWKKLRKLIPGVRYETLSNYLERVIIILERGFII